MSEWQPIETAPMDGDPFLAWNGVSYVIPTMCWETREGHFVWSDGETPATACTHWMPLPEPPDGWVAAPPVEHKPDDDMEWNDE